MNVPNKLTISRIGLTFVMVVFLTFPSIPFGKTLALFTFALAALTDWWDGILARRLDRVSVFGQLMDPLADKILVGAAFVSFVAIDRPPPCDQSLPIVPAWIVITLISREFLITGLRLLAMQQGRVVPASKWGNHKMIWQTVTISVIMLGLALLFALLRSTSPRPLPALRSFPAKEGPPSDGGEGATALADASFCRPLSILYPFSALLSDVAR